MQSRQPSIPAPPLSWFELMSAIWYFLGPRRREFSWWASLTILSQTYTLVPIYLVGKMAQFFVHYHDGASLTPFYAYVAFLGISSSLVALVRLTSKNKLGAIEIDTIYRARVEAFERLMDHSLLWHQEQQSGNNVQNIQNGMGNLRQLMRTVRSDLPDFIVTFVGVAAIFAWLNPIFSLFMVVYLVLLGVIEVAFYRKLQESDDAYYAALEDSGGTYFESANNMLTIKALGVTDAMRDNVDRAEMAARDHANRNRWIGTTKWKWFQIVNSVALVVFLLLLGQAVMHNILQATLILVYFGYLQRLLNSSSQGMNQSMNFIEQKSAIARMMPLFRERSITVDGTKAFPASWREIALVKVAFHYPNQSEPAADDISFSIQRGEKIGIVGRSGSGKSTIAKLLLGLYPLECGSIMVDSVALADIERSSLVKHISVVPQETELFNMSVRDNITMMKRRSKAQVELAMTIAQLEEVVAGLPKGLDTIIGEKGYKLSGGERQRIGVARAICSGADVLILDEATSALDSGTESRIQEALQQSLADRTLVIIAHRLSTLSHVDRILVFNSGKIIEEGSFNELIKNENSHFATMWHLQHRES